MMSQSLIIKAKLGDDIRILPIYSDEISYDELILMLTRIFHDRLTNESDLLLKYLDSEGDSVTLEGAGDLEEALFCQQKKLSIEIFTNSMASVQSMMTDSKLSTPIPVSHAEYLALSDELSTIKCQISELIVRLCSCRPIGNFQNSVNQIKGREQISPELSTFVPKSSANSGVIQSMSTDYYRGGANQHKTAASSNAASFTLQNLNQQQLGYAAYSQVHSAPTGNVRFTGQQAGYQPGYPMVFVSPQQPDQFSYTDYQASPYGLPPNRAPPPPLQTHLRTSNRSVGGVSHARQIGYQ